MSITCGSNEFRAARQPHVVITASSCRPSRRWNVLRPLPCFGQPAAAAGATGGGNLNLLAASSQLQRVLQGAGRQPLEWQQQAVEVLLELMLAARYGRYDMAVM